MDESQQLDRTRRRLERARDHTALLERQLEATRSDRDQAEAERQRARFRLFRIEAERDLLRTHLSRATEDLAAREAELESLRRKLAVVEQRAGESERLRAALERTEAEVARLETELQELREDHEMIGSGSSSELHSALTIERERRRVLERELSRVAAEPEAKRQLAALIDSLQAAGAEILVLSNRLADERRARESLEIAIERVRLAGDLPQGSTDETLGRLQAAMAERRGEGERLALELHEASELIVRLKGRLEAAGIEEGDDSYLVRLETENQLLQEKVAEANAANDELRDKAELAERLAEMLYSGPEG